MKTKTKTIEVDDAVAEQLEYLSGIFMLSESTIIRLLISANDAKALHDKKMRDYLRRRRKV